MKTRLLILASGLAGLLLAGLVLGVARPRLGYAAATAVHTVCTAAAPGCDYTSIQAAIDAAASGDEIRIAQGDYEEHLTIENKALALRGGWNEAFSAQVDKSLLRNPNTQDPIGHGRMITITAEDNATLVSIDRMTIMGGNATYVTPTESMQGAAWAPEIAAVARGEAVVRTLDMTGGPAGSGAAQTGEYTMRIAAQVARLEALAPIRSAAPVTGSLPADAAAPLEPEVLRTTQGGGIYAGNVSLRLTNSQFFYNVASDHEAGQGGAVSVELAKSVEIRDCKFQYNVASSKYTGIGGAVSVYQVDEGRLVLENNEFISNQAGNASDPTIKDSVSSGGGLAITSARGAQVTGNYFFLNQASANGTLGVGGGLFMASAGSSVVRGNRFEANTALNRSRNEQTNDYGSGGGVEINLSSNVLITENEFVGNTAATHLSGWGGGLSVNTSQNAVVSNNLFVENWAVFRMGEWLLQYRNAGGGGISSISCQSCQFLNNTFTRNMAAYWQPPSVDGFLASGGGWFGEQGMNGSILAGNRFEGNVASATALGRGGGAALTFDKGSTVTIWANEFVDNRASQSGPGIGGGIYASNEGIVVRGNRFEGNQASETGQGRGGGFGAEPVQAGFFLHSAELDGNRFVHNSAEDDDGGSGGAVYLLNTGSFNLINNLLIGNTAGQGGGLTLAGSGEAATQRILANNTLVENGAEALHAGNFAQVRLQVINNIFADHTAAVYLDANVAGRTTTEVDNNLFWRNLAAIDGPGRHSGGHEILGDPRFVDAAGDNYRLLHGSPALDAGRSADAPDHDADGALRPYHGAWDLGAFEWPGPPLFLALVFR